MTSRAPSTRQRPASSSAAQMPPASPAPDNSDDEAGNGKCVEDQDGKESENEETGDCASGARGWSPGAIAKSQGMYAKGVPNRVVRKYRPESTASCMTFVTLGSTQNAR